MGLCFMHKAAALVGWAYFIFPAKLGLPEQEIALCMLDSSPVKKYKLHPIILTLCRFHMWHAWIVFHAALLENGLE